MSPQSSEISRLKLEDKGEVRKTGFFGLSFSTKSRRVPLWASSIAVIFGAFVGFVHVLVLMSPALLQTLVAIDGNPSLAWLLGGALMIPVLAIFFLDLLHARALVGFRFMRGKYYFAGQAMVAVTLLFGLGFLNPVLPVPAILGAGFAFLGIWALTWKEIEPEWDLRPTDAISVLSGRDPKGLEIANSKPLDHSLVDSVVSVSIAVTFVLSCALGSWLVDREILTLPAVATFSIMSAWILSRLAKLMRNRFYETLPYALCENRVTTELIGAEDENSWIGLKVKGLSVRNKYRRALLSNISFALRPGQITGVIGESGAGKSLLLQTLVSPNGSRQFEIEGTVSLNGDSAWDGGRAANVPLFLVPEVPPILPVSGQENLFALEDETNRKRASKILEQFVFSADDAEEILNCENASELPSMQRKCLALARSFIVGSPVLLLDRPDEGLPEKQVSALLSRIHQEVRLGRTVILVTESRTLLDACDNLMVLQGGRIVDFGDAAEIREKQNAGWLRFVGRRDLETEENLESWIRSHFKRDGDEENRRNVSFLASELLALSCLSNAQSVSGNLVFEFKHFEGHCILKLIDSGKPISNAQYQQAQALLEDTSREKRLPPLATIIEKSTRIETGTQLDQRVVTVEVETYDPRKTMVADESSLEDAV